MRTQTQETGIPKKVKHVVWERDNHKCIICGQYGEPVAHYIPRSQGGRGIEENIVTLCWMCHRTYDQTDNRDIYGDFIRAYLKSKYPNWNESIIFYRKEC